jgi:phytoene desaturase
MGGLSAAIRLAGLGLEVDVLEAGCRAGGKAGIEVIDGVAVDTGPSVLTMPDAFDRVLEPAGTRLRDEVVLRELNPGFRYRYPDGTVLDVYHRAAETIESVRSALGPTAASELTRFLLRAGRIWEAAAPSFVYGPAPTVGGMVAHGWRGLRMLATIDPLSRMQGAIASQVRDERLRWLLWRYATYNGSDVRRAPATLNCIAHVELSLGGYGVQGGMYALVEALERVARRLGVRFHYDTPVASILTVDGHATGVALTDGRELDADLVVANADAAHVRDQLLIAGSRSGIPTQSAPSMSAWTAILRARRPEGEPRIPHEVIFPARYQDEFVDIFDRDRPPADPTVYLCAQEPCHGRPGWAEHEPVFVMANAPAEPTAGPRPDEVWTRLERAVLASARGAGLAGPDDAVIWRRTPADLARRFVGSRGGIYGAASNSLSAAFRRAPNRVPGVRGLYLASGSAHPGGGVPMAALSGVAAAVAVAEDLRLSQTTIAQAGLA